MKLGRYFGVSNNVDGLPRTAGRVRWVTRILGATEAPKSRSVNLASPYMEGLRRSVRDLEKDHGAEDL